MSRQKQLKTILMDEKLPETTNLGVKIMNSKRQIKTKLGHVVKIRVTWSRGKNSRNLVTW